MAVSASSTLLKQMVDDIIQCPICFEYFTDPRSLPCIHAFCLKCLQQYTRDLNPGEEMPCPVCRKPFQMPYDGVSSIPKNFFMDKLLWIKKSGIGGQSMTTICQVCEAAGEVETGKINAEEYCIECHEMMCCSCAKTHKHSRSTRSHRVVKLGEISSSEFQDMIKNTSQSHCPKHPNQTLDVFCSDCKTAICVVCLGVTHKQHKCVDIKEAVASLRQQIISDGESLKTGIKKLGEIFDSVDKQKQELDKQVGETEKQIIKRANDLIRLVEQNKQTVLEELRVTKQETNKQLEDLSYRIKLEMSLMDNLKKYSDELIAKGSSSDIASESNAVHERVEELLKTEACETRFIKVSFTPSTLCSAKREDIIGTIDVQYIDRNVDSVLTTILPGGNSPIVGLTLGHGELFIARYKSQQQIQVYDTSTFVSVRNISVPRLQNSSGLTSCSVNYCLYVSEHNKNSVFRIELSANNYVSSWPVGRGPAGLFVNSLNNVIVTCRDDNKLQEFTTCGALVREISYQNTGITDCFYALQLPNDEFVLSSSAWDVVFKINSNGDIVMKYDNSAPDAQLQGPVGLAHLSNGCFLIACDSGSKVKILNSSLSLSRDLSLPVNSGLGQLWSLCYEESRGRLYVGEYKTKKSRAFVFDNVFCLNSEFHGI